jgi:hypothetical protein
MYRVSDLSNKYAYDFSLKKSLVKIFSPELDRNDPHQITAFINQFVIAHEWEWNELTLYACQRLELLIQEKLPKEITNKKEVYKWLVRNWRK